MLELRTIHRANEIVGAVPSDGTGYQFCLSNDLLGWRLDVCSATIGVTAGLIVAWLVHRCFRKEIRLGLEAVVAPLVKIREGLRATAEDRYREQVISRMRALVVPSVVPLDAVFVEPYLVAPRDFPQLVADLESMPRQAVELPYHEVFGKHTRFAILGAMGAGRTTLLAHLALVCAETTESSLEIGRAIGLSERALPIFIWLPALDWGVYDQHQARTSRKRAQESDEVLRLINSATAALARGKQFAGILLECLQSGETIVLIDGWDELGEVQAQRAADWLAGLADSLPGNLWVVAAGTRGYAPLTAASFIPLTLATWGTSQAEALAEKWLASFGRSTQTPADIQELHAQLQSDARSGSTPFELALRAFVHLSGGDPADRRGELCQRALDFALGDEPAQEPWLLDACHAALESLALRLQQTGYSTAGLQATEDLIRGTAIPLEEHPARAKSLVLQTITTDGGALREVSDHLLAFSHVLWQAFLVARHLSVAGPTSIVDHLENARWYEVVRFYAEAGDMGPVIAAWSRVRDDAFCTRVRTLGSWIKAAPHDADWRDGSMAILARSFLQTSLPLSVRLSLAEALARTGASGIDYFFRTALRHLDTDVRTAAIVGLSRVATDSDQPVLADMLEDPVPAVRRAAVRGLSLLGTSAAWRRLEQVLLFVIT